MKRLLLFLFIIASMTVAPSLKNASAKPTGCVAKICSIEKKPVAETEDNGEPVFKMPCYLIMDI